MPFSIKRFTHLHRSQSLPGPKEEKPPPVGSKGEKVSKTSSSSSTAKQAKKTSSEKKPSKHKKVNEICNDGRNVCSVSLSATINNANEPNYSMSQAYITQPNISSYHKVAYMDNGANQYNMAPPSFVICSQSALNSGPTVQFGNINSINNNSSSSSNANTTTTTAINVPISNSRSFDSNEMRRFVNQSSKSIITPFHTNCLHFGTFCFGFRLFLLFDVLAHVSSQQFHYAITQSEFIFVFHSGLKMCR